MEAALREEFSRNDFTLEDDAVAQHCTSLCVTFGKKPADFVSSWEVFYMNRQLDGGQVSNSRMNGFKQFLEEEQKEAFVLKQKKTGFHTYTSNHLDLLLNDEEDEPLQITPPRSLSATSKRVTIPGSANVSSIEADVASVAPKTPAATHKSAGEAPRPNCEESPITPFSRRSNKSAILVAFNEELKELEDTRVQADSEDDILRRLKPIEWCEVDVVSKYPKTGCRFMHDRVEDRFLAIERRIRRFAGALMASEQCKVSHNVAVAAQEQITVVGRICCDGEGHLNDKSVLLEGSVEYSGGQRVRLDLRNIPQFSMFPGQVLGIEGQNPSGYCLVASRLIDAIPLTAAPESSEQVEPPSKRRDGSHVKSETVEAVDPQQITIVTAAGPYSASDNLYFEPLAELFAYARRKRPRLLILMGPFVDSEHPLIKQGLVEKTFKQIFHEEFRTRIVNYCHEMGDGARVLLIPSCRDAHHDSVFPQPPFSTEGFEDVSDQVVVLANPSIVRCDEVTLGFCTVDVLRHLSSEEMSRIPPGASSDRMTRIASHIIAQRSFYPLFPPPPGTPLDLSLVPEALSISEIPDILILPSDLAPFVKVLSHSSFWKSQNEDGSGPNLLGSMTSSTLCINPGRLTKGLSGGSFSEMLILPRSIPSTDLVEDSSSSPLSGRSKVLIRRI
ncbi:unnamed protein product [Calypogeia fissa]